MNKYFTTVNIKNYDYIRNHFNLFISGLVDLKLVEEKKILHSIKNDEYCS